MKLKQQNFISNTVHYALTLLKKKKKLFNYNITNKKKIYFSFFISHDATEGDKVKWDTYPRIGSIHRAHGGNWARNVRRKHKIEKENERKMGGRENKREKKIVVEGKRRKDGVEIIKPTQVFTTRCSLRWVIKTPLN